ncbi:sodA [Symbiodinium pilosum]|uniref:SodA protein n=1 Tax=Symbiodinium pilosum TaxID=2952 RepID=A0A812WTW6_SYMPI|nr:sodA [Symbiodinium pilosum]
MCSNYKRHLSAEDRRILRVRVKHHMRGKPSWPTNVYEAEKVLLQTFAKSPELCTAFYLNNDFCEKLLTQAAIAFEYGVYQDAPAHTQLRMNSPHWEESVQNRVETAAAEAGT